MTFNPIIRRELVAALRSPWALAMQFIPALVFTALIVLRWPSSDQVDIAGGQARRVFAVFGYGLLALLLLLGPAYPAASLTRERKQGTLALLLHTPLGRWSIYLGHLCGGLGFVALPMVMSLPSMAACYALGGISVLHEIVPLYGILAIATVQFVILALWVSSFAASTDSAVRLTYGLVLGLAILPLGPYFFLQGSPDNPLYTPAHWLRSLSPIAAVTEILGQSSAGIQGLAVRAGTPARYVFLAIATSAIAGLHTAMRLKPTIFDKARPSGVMTEDRARSQRWRRRLFFLVDPQRRSGAIGAWTNPVFVKEFRTRRFGRSQWLLRMVALCALISLGLTYAATTGTLAWGVPTIGGIMVLLQVALIVVLTPSLSAGLVSSEREAGGWALLQMTPLSAGRILRGKLLSVAVTVVLLLFATLPGYAVMIAIQPVLRQQVTAVIVCLLLTGGLAISVSAAASSFFRRTMPATVVSYGLLIAVFGGTLLVWLARNAPFGPGVVRTALLANPIAAAFQIIEVDGFSEYDLLPANWWVVGGLTLISLIVLTLRTRRLLSPH